MKRLICAGCGRPQRVCLCSALVPRSLPVGLVILQDTDESQHPLSTAPLLQRSFPASRLLVGTVFNRHEVLGDIPVADAALLYPLESKAALTVADYPKVKQLIVLDGTWRKVRKMLLNNPWLTQLPHLSLQPEQSGRYAIRSSPRADGVSTLEAAVMALELLDSNTEYREALAVLDLLVKQQQSFGHKQ